MKQMAGLFALLGLAGGGFFGLTWAVEHAPGAQIVFAAIGAVVGFIASAMLWVFLANAMQKK